MLTRGLKSYNDPGRANQVQNNSTRGAGLAKEVDDESIRGRCGSTGQLEIPTEAGHDQSGGGQTEPCQDSAMSIGGGFD